MKKSMIEVAYQVLTNNNGSMPFVDLWKDVSQEMGFNQTQFEDNIAQFYTDLSLDGRFLNMSQNTWDLRSRHTYSESVMDTDSIAIDEDDEDEEEAAAMIPPATSPTSPKAPVTIAMPIIPSLLVLSSTSLCKVRACLQSG